MDKIKVKYNPIAVSRLTNFFDVRTNDEGLKQVAWDSIEMAQSRATASL